MKKKQRVFSTVLGIEIHNLSIDETVFQIVDSIEAGNRINHIVVNAGKLVEMQNDKELYNSVRDADLINADGMAVVWASKFLGDPLPERVAGIDLMNELVKIARKEQFKIFFFGAKEDVVSKVVDMYSSEYGNDIIAGYRNGYYGNEEEESIVKEIADSKADILFVAITSPKKEIFLNKYKHALNVPFTMGVGGSFDVVAGITKRAPIWMQKFGLEWFYRLVQEPKRMWKRYLIGNTKFILLILKQKLGFYKNPWTN